MKVLNLYAGIGGNRKLWMDVEVTAVELKPEIASIYQGFYPNDKVIVGEALLRGKRQKLLRAVNQTQSDRYALLLDKLSCGAVKYFNEGP